MSYDEFKEAVVAELEEYYGGDARIVVKDVLKNNDVHLDGISIIQDPAEKINPVIYLNDIYERYVADDLTMDAVVGRVVDLCEQHRHVADLDEVEVILSDWEKAKEYVFPMLAQTSANEDVLSTLVSKPFLDLSIIYAIHLNSQSFGGLATVKISPAILDRYGITEDELHEQAMHNLQTKDTLRVEDMFDVLLDLCPMNASFEADDTGTMHVLSNASRYYGAAQLLNMDRIEGKYAGRSFYVLPSSVHEAILLDYSDDIEPEQLNAMIREINGTVLGAQDILSDHCYFFDGNTRKLQMCA